NFPEVLRRELDKPTWTRELVALGTATDPYQPIEGHYKLTRRTIEALIAARTPVGIVTKGPMIVRDADLLAELSRVAKCTVCLSVPTVDEDAWRALEPGTAHPLQRLRAVRKLREAGINAGVLMAPVVPGFTTRSDKLAATIKACADHDAAFVGANVLYLKGGTKDHFMGFLRHSFPDMVHRYEKLYSGAYASPEYAGTVRALIEMFQEKYDVNRRTRRARTEDLPAPPPAARQAGLDF
ncbi:MAG TPA: radical SAM protein, partial [Vicinamibacterales bacterium]|nr:radical SAM protein [Vicinamibacterales bacterium]